MGCGEKMAKTFMFVFNAIFFLCGAALLAVGIWIVVDKNTLVKLAAKAGSDSVSNQLNAGSVVDYAAYIMIAVGCLAFVVGFCGCCGACKENVCLLRMYAFFIGVLLILQIAGVVIAAIFKKDIESKLMDGLIKLQNETYVGLPIENKQNSASLAFDITMVALQCCGVNGSTDFTRDYKKNADKWYKVGRKANTTTLKIPYACCKMSNTDFMKQGTYDKIAENRKSTECGPKETENYNTGCFDQIKSKVEKYAVVIIAIAIVIVLIEILGIVVTCFLIREIDD